MISTGTMVLIPFIEVQIFLRQFTEQYNPYCPYGKAEASQSALLTGLPEINTSHYHTGRRTLDQSKCLIQDHPAHNRCIHRYEVDI